LIGALLALALTQNSLNIFSILGIIMLIGLVAKNAILIVDFANQLKAEGKASFEALIEAWQTRLRPILMTTIAMVIGLLPIAIAKGAGAEWKNGLAWALMGGLTSSMVFTLVLVPVVYYMVDLAKEKLQQLKPKKQETLQTA
jgi:HAE1 family hydrophobic/amphiphilic exporter-1